MSREFGILMHPSSLPSAHGVGDLGVEAKRFADWLAQAGAKVWQILPLVPPGAGNSPYSTWSAFSGNPALISLDGLVEQGLLPPLGPYGGANADRADFAAVNAFKNERLSMAARVLLMDASTPLYAAYSAYRATNEWVIDAGLFRALKTAHDEKAWWQWPEPLKCRDESAIEEALENFAEAIDEFCVIQFLFHHQWTELRKYCAERHIEILGDMPIYVDADSVDVWCEQSQFQLSDDGTPTSVAGVPPDAFSETGQLWGNPLYDWDRMHADGYQWWIRRLRRAFELTDRVRIDHFRGLSAYWAVPASAEDARSGEWKPGPGAVFFDAIRDALGDDLAIVAEDLGTIDQDVVALVEAADVPNMLVLQFAFGGEADNWYLPHMHGKKSVVYTGTHDNDTTTGWWHHTSEHVRDHVRHYFGTDGHDIAWTMIRSALASVAETAVIPVQDVLSLDSGARMNTPSVGLGNWGWRLQPGQLGRDTADRLHFLAKLYRRTH